MFTEADPPANGSETVKVTPVHPGGRRGACTAVTGYDLAGDVDLHIDGFGIVTVKFRQSCAWDFDVPEQLCSVAIGNGCSPQIVAICAVTFVGSRDWDDQLLTRVDTLGCIRGLHLQVINMLYVG